MASKQKGSKKHGRNKPFCTVYSNEQRREKSHVRRIVKHLRRFAGDNSARARLKVLLAGLPLGFRKTYNHIAEAR